MARRHHGQRCLLGNALGDLHRLGECLPGRHHTLHKVQPQSLGAAEFIAGEQVQHGIAQARAFGHAQGGAAGGHDAAFHFELREAAIVRSHHHIGGQHEFNAQGVGDALHSHHHRFDAAAVPSHA